MKLPSKYKHLQAAGVAALLALGFNSQASAAAFPPFTVDPNGAFGAVGGPHPGPFQADFITGNSSTLVTTPGGGIATGSGWVNFSAFVDAGSNVLATTSGLNSNWQMWAEFTYDFSTDPGPYAKPGRTTPLQPCTRPYGSILLLQLPLHLFLHRTPVERQRSPTEPMPFRLQLQT